MDLKPGKVRDLSSRDLLQLHKEQRATLSNTFLSTPGSQRHLCLHHALLQGTLPVALFPLQGRTLTSLRKWRWA